MSIRRLPQDSLNPRLSTPRYVLRVSGHVNWARTKDSVCTEPLGIFARAAVSKTVSVFHHRHDHRLHVPLIRHSEVSRLPIKMADWGRGKTIIIQGGQRV